MVFTHRKIRGLISFNHILSPYMKLTYARGQSFVTASNPRLFYGWIYFNIIQKFSSFYENCIIGQVEQFHIYFILTKNFLFYFYTWDFFFSSQSTFLTSATLKEKGFITSYIFTLLPEATKIEQKSNIIYKRRIFIFYTKCMDVEYIKNIIKEMVHSFLFFNPSAILWL